MKKKNFGVITFLVAVVLLSVPSAWAEHVVFVIGEKEYKTNESLREFFDSELKPAGFTAKFFTPPAEGEAMHDFDGLAEELGKADLVVVSVRRRAPAKKDLDALRQFLEAGKPLIGIRTTSHAFHLKGKPVPEGHAVWEAFDPEVLGGNYNGHFSDAPFKITIAKGAIEHPILKGVNYTHSARLYRSGPLAKAATPLLIGSLEGEPAEPIAWTHQFGPKKARIFYTSLGIVEDFQEEGFRQLFTNAFRWAVQK